ncbi:hypothetical protein [Streptomyces sp. NPDC000405]|uniref:hypothetical protein n=1 Tax=Streptomyces sp. NPDC000405 TaxID=3161033 RepID=UPI00398D258A
MHPPHFSTETWWIISAVATGAFYAVCLPMMARRQHKVRMAFIPPVTIACLLVAGALRGHGAEELLHIYSTVVLIFPLALVGRRKELREALEQQERNSLMGAEESLPPMKLFVQMCASVVVMFLAWCWLTWG